MSFRVRGPDRRRFDDGSRRGMHDRRRGGDRRGGDCVLEGLESRQMLAGDPVFVGPYLPHSNPQSGFVAPGSGPSSELRGVNITADTPASYTFDVVYRDDIAVRYRTIDSLDIRVIGPNGYARTATLISVDRATDGAVRIGRYKIAAPGGAWDAHDNGRYTVYLRPDQVFDTSGEAAGDGIIGEFHVQIAGGVGQPLAPPIVYGLDVRDFGAIPNDGLDDSDAIQAAIDALPKGPGVPMGSSPVGGVVLLPAGVWDLAKPLRIHSGVTLRGAGFGTVLHDVQTDRTSSAIQLVSPFAHHFNIGVTIEHLTLYTRWARGIAIDPRMGGDVNDLRLNDLRVSAFGPAIDLRDQRVFHTDIDDVEVYNPGSTALHIGRPDGVSFVNRMRNFRVTGTARGGFRAERALVHLGGDTLVTGGISITARGARVLPLYIDGRANIDHLRIDVPATDLPAAIAVQINQVAFAIFDTIEGLGTGRRMLLTSGQDVQVKHVTSDGTSNILSRLVSRDAGSYIRVGNAVGGRLQAVPPPAPPPPHVPVPAPTNVIDATAFGVVGDDGVDDTAELQAAIDSLPRGNGIPGSSANQPVGGIVQLPQGTLNLSAPIKLPSGVWLRGHGNGTALHNPVTPAGRAVIELTSPYAHHANVGAGLIDLGMYAALAGGIKPDQTVAGELRDLRLAGLRLFVKGPAIDLRSGIVNYANIDRVVIRDPGSTAIWVGCEDNSGTGNYVRAVRVAGRAPIDFVAEKALFVFHGDTRVESGSIEDTYAAVLPFYASGAIHMLDLYMEYPQQPDGVGFVFDGARGYVDNLYHVDPQRQVLFLNGAHVEFGNLNIVGYTTPLRYCIVVDATSKAIFNTVGTQFDAGLLDHPRAIVRGVFSLNARRFVETSVALAEPNLVADPDMTDVSDAHPAKWEILWGDQFGAIQGTWAVETVGGVKRLKLTVLSNPNHRKLTLRVKLNVPASAVGRPGIARWRVDGAGEVFAWTYAYSAQFLGRVTKSLTAVAAPRPIAAGEQLWIDIPDARGTYYVSKIGFVAA